LLEAPESFVADHTHATPDVAGTNTTARHALAVTDAGAAFDEFIIQLANACINASSVFLDGRTVGKHDTGPDAQWRLDADSWVEAFGSDEPGGWISEIAVGYLGEAAYELKAIAKLLRSRIVAGTIDPLVRAVLERSGRVIWVLDDEPPDGTAFNRAARAALEIGISSQHYLETIRTLGATKDQCEIAEAYDDRHRSLLIEWFKPQRPNPAEDVRKWKINGEASPGFTAIARFAGERCRITPQQGGGMYGGLSGFAHPSIVFSRENRVPTESGGLEFNYRAADLEKVVRMAILTFLEAVKYCARYYATGIDRFNERVMLIECRLDEITILIPGENSPE
jgi:hypothetical protein